MRSDWEAKPICIWEKREDFEAISDETGLLQNGPEYPIFINDIAPHPTSCKASGGVSFFKGAS
jgi:hypothetical protein